MGKFSKEYNSMIKKNSKEIMKLAKKASTTPFDSNIALELLVASLKFMRDYYKLGENVHSEEVKYFNDDCVTKMTRLESLEETIKIYEKWKEYQYKIFKQEDIERCEEFKKRFFDLLYNYIDEWWD